ncbi:MAG: hypothetical protein WCV81_05160 [Microgenomates group bacterium]
MDQQVEIEKPQLQVDLETYLSKIPEADKNHLRSLADNFQKVMKKQGRSGSLVIVGGSITKPWPRKDIDILLLRNRSPQDVPRGDRTIYKYTLAEYEELKNIIEKIAANTDLKIDNEHSVEPLIDEEFGSETILRHDGNIVIKSDADKGIPLEFVSMSKRGSYRDGLIQGGKPFVVLAENL